MNGAGILIGAIAFALIGLFHPIVVKGEYYFSARIWPVFLGAGLLFCAASLFVANVVLSATLAVTGVSSLWSIGEIREQERRVQKGWFPENPRKRRLSNENAQTKTTLQNKK